MFGISEFTVRWTGLLALALAVIPGGVDAQAPDLEETRTSAERPESWWTFQVRSATWASIRRSPGEAAAQAY